jgi:hypothetical protein
MHVSAAHAASRAVRHHHQVTFVGAGFTRKPPKYERFIRPTGEA